jgi:hypothetical protein
MGGMCGVVVSWGQLLVVERMASRGCCVLLRQGVSHRLVQLQSALYMQGSTQQSACFKQWW